MPKPSTLKRPAQKLLDKFTVDQINAGDTIEDYLRKGFSLAICCKRCPRTVEWTPPELEERFGDNPKLRIADLAGRLSCTGKDGCGSDEVAVFPHPYDGEWRWTSRSRPS